MFLLITGIRFEWSMEEVAYLKPFKLKKNILKKGQIFH